MPFGIYLDEDASDSDLVDALRRQDVLVLTANSMSTNGTADETQLMLATERDLVLYSYNIGDYLALHSHWLENDRRHAGLILVPQQRFSVGEQLRRILTIRRELPAEQMRGRVEFLANWNRK